MDVIETELDTLLAASPNGYTNGNDSFMEDGGIGTTDDEDFTMESKHNDFWED